MDVASSGEKRRGRKAPKRVVEYVNRLRAQMGEGPLKDLPTGRINAATSCPIARALPAEVEVDVGYIHVYAGPAAYTGPETLTPPKYVDQFIKRFDDGGYPDLIRR